MIPFNFEYHVPDSVEEAVDIYKIMEKDDKSPVYYSGGTEIISFSRQGKIRTGAVIDLKSIPETQVFKKENEHLVTGASLSLTVLSEQDLFPFLSGVVRYIADRTIRNRLTLGGNICSRLPFREAILPFLLADAEAVLAGPSGQRSAALNKLFDKRMRLEKGEFIIKLLTPLSALKTAFWHKRRVKHGPVDYPLLHTAATINGDKLALAITGLCAYPFRSGALEDVLGDSRIDASERVDRAVSLLPGDIRNDDLASADYRQALWRYDLKELFEEMEGLQ